jgi:type IV secretory pathway VirB10-like protein
MTGLDIDSANKKTPPHSPLFADESEQKKSKRMFGQKILAFAFLVLIVALYFIIMAANSMPKAGEQNQNRSDRNANMSDPTKLQDELIAAAEAAKHEKVRIVERSVIERVSPDVYIAPAASGGSQIIVVQAPAPVRRERNVRSLSSEALEAGRRYRDMKRESLLSKSAVNGFDDLSRESAVSAPTREELMLKMLENLAYGANGNADSEANALAMFQGEGANPQDPNAYRHKLDFLTRDGGSRTPQDYSPNIRQPPLAPMEVKAGTVIPGILLVGVNSDLPGTVVGQVSENVYDTATGRWLLIPQGTRIVGVYDSRITSGQKRVSIVWNRLIYPDGSSLNIAGSPGTDMAGYSGVRGRVDNHYGQLLTAALFTSIFTAAADIASGSDDTSYNSNRKSAKDVLVETTGTVIANTGARLAGRALDIQPTITVRPGSRFNVMVTRDVAFLSPWKPAKTQVDGF